MERKVGEVFDSKGIKLQVKETVDSCFCFGCYFYESECTCDTEDHINQVGACFGIDRTDDKNVIFVEVKNNQN